MKWSILICLQVMALYLCGCRTGHLTKKVDIISTEYPALSAIKAYTDRDQSNFVDSCLLEIDGLAEATMFDNLASKSGRASISSPNYMTILQKLDQRVLSVQGGLSIDFLLGIDNLGSVPVALVKEMPSVQYFAESDLKMISYYLLKDQKYEPESSSPCLDFALYNFSINR
jgi:hypothetical protein